MIAPDTGIAAPPAGERPLTTLSATAPAPNLEGFPDLPACRADYWPVFVTPSLGSGERVVCGFVARGPTGEVDVFQVLSENACLAVFTDGAGRFASLVSDVLAHAQRHLSRTGSMAAWKAPLEGFEPGEASFIHGDDLTDALRSAAYLSGGLFALREADTWRQASPG